MNFLIIGSSGLIGKERIVALEKLKLEGFDIDNIYCYDIIKSTNPNAINISKEEITNLDIDWAIIAVQHYLALEYVKLIAPMGCKILLEKPMGRNLEEAQEIYSALLYPTQLYLGFNYRFYRGIQQLFEDVLDNKFGQIVSINAVIGHGGKPEDANNWQVDPIKCGKNSLLDPGIHILDLLNFMFPRRAIPLCMKEWKGSWNTGIGEENHVLMDINSTIVNIQTSLVKWRSTFEIRVNGTERYGIIAGKGRSYGDQTYTRGIKWGWRSGESQKETEELVIKDNCQNSFYDELKSLLSNQTYNCTAYQGLNNMILYDNCLKAER